MLSEDRLARHADRVVDARRRRQGDLARSARIDLVGALQAGAVGQLDVDEQVALVLLRDEAGRARA